VAAGSRSAPSATTSTSASNAPASVSTRRASGSMAVTLACTNRAPGLSRSEYGWSTASGCSRPNITSSFENPKTNPSVRSIRTTSPPGPSSPANREVSSKPPKPAPNTKTRIRRTLRVAVAAHNPLSVTTLGSGPRQ
jgi:hypothetical protein